MRLRPKFIFLLFLCVFEEARVTRQGRYVTRVANHHPSCTLPKDAP